MFKGYSSKSSALKGAARANVAASDVYLGDCNGEMKWGFMVTAQAEPEAPVADQPAAEPTDTAAADHTVASDTEVDPELAADLESQVDDIMREEGLADSESEPEGDGELGLFPQPSANMFGGIAATLANAATAAPAATGSTSTRTAYTIEKDRPMQNGVKRPSAGGLCRAVWDWCWEQQAADASAPTSKSVRAQAEAVGWNTNNAMIEFYNWRKYNGISGRTAAPAAAVPAAQ